MEPMLELEDLTKSFADQAVLRGVTLTVHAGEVLGLVGENGVGKSTLLGILSGSDQPDGGSSRLEGRAYQPQDPAEALARGVTIIKQYPQLDARHTVAESIYRHASEPADAADLAARARGLVRGLRLELPVDAPIQQLVPSARGMVEVARVCAENAGLIIMDEVTAGFSPSEVAHLHRIIRALAAQGRAIIYVSHQLDELRAVSDRVAVLVDGRVSETFAADEVSTDTIADAMLTRSYRAQRSRAGHVRDDVVLSVRDMQSPDLDHVSFDVHRGEVLGLVGSRRSGAAQIAGMLVGDHRGTVGTFRFDGADQPPANPTEAKSLGIGYLADTGEADLRDSTLSGGEQRKSVVRGWIDGRHPLLVLENPCRGIDVGSRRDIYNAVAEHTQAGNSVVLLTNDTTELLDWCDRIAIVKNGRIQSLVPASELDHDDLIWAMSARAM